MLTRALFADDIFISYARADGMRYATALAARLSTLGYSCRLDVYDTVPSTQLPALLRRDLQRCTMLVLVATEAAAQSVAVDQELEAFGATGRRILVVGRAEVLRTARWAQRIAGLPGQDEPEIALATGQPGQAIIETIGNAMTYWRRNRRIRLVLQATVLAVLAGLAALAWIGWQANQAVLQRDSARQQVLAVDRQLGTQTSKLQAADTALAQQQRRLGDADAALQAGAQQLATQRAALSSQQLLNEASRSAGVLLERRLARRFDPAQDVAQALRAAHGFQRAGVQAPAVAVLFENTGLMPQLAHVLQHPGGFRAFAWTAGDRLATAGQDGQLRLWDVASGRLLAARAMPGPVSALQASPDKRRLLVLSQSPGADALVQVLDLGSLQTAGPTAQPAPLAPAHQLACPQPRRPMVWAPDGRSVALVCDGKVLVWPLQSGQQTKLAAGDVSQLQFSAQGDKLVVLRMHGEEAEYALSVYRLPGGQAEVRADSACAGRGRRHSFDAQGRFHASACDNSVPAESCNVQLCALDSGRLIATLPTAQNALRFDPGGNLLVSTGGSQISFWSAADGQKLAGWADDRQPPVLGGFGPRYRSVVLLQSGWASLVDGDSAETLAMFPLGLRKADSAELLQLLGVVGDGSRGVAADPRSGQIEVWALQTLPQQSRLADSVESFAFSPDGRQLLTGMPGRDGSLALWDWPGGQRRAAWSADAEGRRPTWAQDWMLQALASPAWLAQAGRSAAAAPLEARSADGRLRAAVGEFGVQVWAGSDPRPRALLRSGRAPRALAFSPDGQAVLGLVGQQLQVWPWQLATHRAASCAALAANQSSPAWRDLAGPGQGWRLDCAAD